MVRICKPGGYIYLRHHAHEGKRLGYKGLHQWNLDLAQDGDCIFWNKTGVPNETFLLSDIYPGFTSQVKPMSKMMLITSFVQKKPEATQAQTVLSPKKNDLTVIYYTSNWLDTHNPYFLENTRKQLLKAIGDLPMIIVSQKPTLFGENSRDVCLGDIGRSHLNIYRQILWGARVAKTKYVAMAEDDILYSYEHFHTYFPEKDVFAYDMSKWSLFTWTKPPLFSLIPRKVVNSLIAKRDMLIESLEERFKRFDKLIGEGQKEEDIIPHWGDPGRYENLLGVTIRGSEEFNSTVPNIVFSHEEAFGYLSRGTRKKLGTIRATEIPYWGRAEEIVKLYYKNL